MKEKLYLAYGSNLNIVQMIIRCPDAKFYGTAEIKDYELLFKGSKTGAYLTIERRKGSNVPVGVWAVTERDISALDRYEGFPAFYYKNSDSRYGARTARTWASTTALLTLCVRIGG